ncbi:endo-beta-N-acetylglucosaminidase [Spiroplasma endosymbiont of Aspidapion aeneum]|uniref:endo-beta-N-acetylglucosaminidase n=1 Tax=Spiroplasma endosymbiont of Aspidapion aeneum TaxID=3066276 RepID=UPI00313C52BD
MKKSILLTNVLVSTIFICSPFLTSCYFDYGVNLSEISDYDWKKEEPYYQQNDGTLREDDNSNEVSADDIKFENNDNDNIVFDNKGSFMDLTKFNTYYKNPDSIKKQTPTGVPLNKTFLPNGQKKMQYSKITPDKFYDTINTLNRWDYNKDKDAKYNTSRIPLQPSKKTKNHWVNNQYDKVKEMNMGVQVSSTAKQSTIVGSNRAYSTSFNEYQYNDIDIAWSGSISEGIITPPSREQTDKAHINGTKMFGIVYLDGYYGLNRESTAGLLTKDSSGNYLIVNTLINMAKNMKFDGWFWNNEPNGSQPNGSVLGYDVVVDILKQLRNKISTSNDEDIKKLEIVGYKNDGTLGFDNTGLPINDESKQIKENTDHFVSDFYTFANENGNYFDKYYKNSPDFDKRYNVYGMYNLGGWVDSKIWYDSNNLGTRDFRDITNYPAKDGKLLNPDTSVNEYKSGNGFSFKSRESFDEPNSKLTTPQQSLSLFSSQTPSDLASAKAHINDEHKVQTSENDKFALTLTNDYSDKTYTGVHKSLANNDVGLCAYPENKKVYTDNTDYKKYSFGVGDIVSEKTTITDNNPFFRTNFSTGQGVKYASLDHNNKRVIANKYPWTNETIADVQPTYKWMVDDQYNSTNKILTSVDGFSGFYDYDNPYLKGNSICLGGSLTEKYYISPANWIADHNYTWSILGTNYSNDNPRKVSIVYKSDNSNVIDPNNVNISAKKQGDKSSWDISKATDVKISDTSHTSLGDGWWKITATVNANFDHLGINFTPKSTGKAKINIGEITISNQGVKNKTNTQKLNPKLSSEYEILRKNKKSMRLNFENIINDNIYSYYEVYKTDATNKLVLLGQTNSDNYYIKNLDSNDNQIFVKAINYDNTTDPVISWYKYKI